MAKRKPAVGDPFRVDGARHTITAVKKNLRGVEQVDAVPTDPEKVPHNLISFHAGDLVWDADWDYWVVPGRELARPARVTATVKEG